MTNSPALASALERRCTGIGGRCSRRRGGVHSHASGAVAARVAVYPQRLCAAILRGCQRQLYDDGVLLVGHHGLQARRRKAAEERNEERRHSMRLEVFFEEEFTGRGYSEFMETVNAETEAALATESVSPPSVALRRVAKLSARAQKIVGRTSKFRRRGQCQTINLAWPGLGKSLQHAKVADWGIAAW